MMTDAPQKQAPVGEKAETKWSEGQLRALDLLFTRKPFFVGGAGGVGKSTLISEFVRRAQAAGQTVAVTAASGVAATLLCADIPDVVGMTLHRWAAIGNGRGSAATLATFIKKIWPLKRRWQTTDILILDEVSMISDDLLQKLDAIGRDVRSEFDPLLASIPFGGLQVIVSGDFMQLPPVEGRFCFHAPIWAQAFPPERCVILNRNFRQNEGDGYLRVVNEARFGALSDKSFAALSTRVVPEPPSLDCVDPPTSLVPHRRTATEINNRRLAAIAGPSTPYASRWERNAKKSKKTTDSYHMYMQNKAADPLIQIKAGAKVMYRVNDADAGVYNGTCGIVKGFTPVSKLPIVEFENGIRLTVQTHAFEAPEDAGYYHQIPLILAWAITIHKAQGCQLVRARVDAGEATFACGQAYVAISRVVSLAGVEFSSLSKGAFRADPAASKFYVALFRADEARKARKLEAAATHTELEA